MAALSGRAEQPSTPGFTEENWRTKKVVAFVIHSCYKMTSPSARAGCFWATCNVFFKKTRIGFRGEVCLFSATNLFPARVLTMSTTKPRAKLPTVKPAAKLSSSKPGSAKTKAKTIIAKPHTAKPYTAKLLTKEHVISAIQAAARKLGHAPNSRELRRLSGTTASQVARRFGTYRAAVSAAGLKPNPAGVRVEAAALLEDWGKVARKLGRVPSNSEYERAGGYSRCCFTRAFGSWAEVPTAFSRFVASGGLAGNWTDVLEMVREGPMPTCGKCGRLAERREAVRLASGAEVRKKSVRAQLETQPPPAGVE